MFPSGAKPGTPNGPVVAEESGFPVRDGGSIPCRTAFPRAGSPLRAGRPRPARAARAALHRRCPPRGGEPTGCRVTEGAAGRRAEPAEPAEPPGRASRVPTRLRTERGHVADGNADGNADGR
ncbi:hypothetical protein GCM10027160_45120 [Streptomyces calidiresistens]